VLAPARVARPGLAARRADVDLAAERPCPAADSAEPARDAFRAVEVTAEPRVADAAEVTGATVRVTGRRTRPTVEVTLEDAAEVTGAIAGTGGRLTLERTGAITGATTWFIGERTGETAGTSTCTTAERIGAATRPTGVASAPSTEPTARGAGWTGCWRGRAGAVARAEQHPAQHGASNEQEQLDSAHDGVAQRCALTVTCTAVTARSLFGLDQPLPPSSLATNR